MEISGQECVKPTTDTIQVCPFSQLIFDAAYAILNVQNDKKGLVGLKNDLRQQLHPEPQSGWLNDPNGLCFFKGRYHVYFQYAPGSADGSGKKCWGHFQSRNLTSWEFTGTVLFPDSPDDADGVFSGSAR